MGPGAELSQHQAGPEPEAQDLQSQASRYRRTRDKHPPRTVYRCPCSAGAQASVQPRIDGREADVQRVLLDRFVLPGQPLREPSEPESPLRPAARGSAPRRGGMEGAGCQWPPRAKRATADD